MFSEFSMLLLLLLLSETNVSVTGPSTWRGTCLVGEKQSPINLPDMAKGSKKTPGFQELVFKYQAGVDTAFVSNPGHGSMQVSDLCRACF